MAAGLGESGDRLFRMSFEPAEIDHAPGVRHFTLAIPLELAGGSTLSRLRVMGEGAVAERRASNEESRIAEPPDRPDRPDRPVRPVAVQRAGPDGVTLRWNQAAFPLLVARDSETGRVLGIGHSGTLTIRPIRRPIAAILSNGIRSASLRLTPQ